MTDDTQTPETKPGPDDGRPEAPAGAKRFLRWPPPGLERMQGDLWRVASRGALAGGFLVLPLLFVVGGETEVVTLGPFADAWWITLVVATIGLGFALDGLTTMARILKRAAWAMGQGYDAKTVGHVLADLRKDMGFLLQGGRHFSVMDERERRAIAGLRVFSVSAHAVAGLWMPVMLAVGLLMGARGAIEPRILSMLTLMPAALLYVLGAMTGALEDGRVRRARKKFFQQPWAADLVTDEIAAWREDLVEQQGPEAVRAASAGVATLFGRLSFVVGALGVVVAVPILTLVPASGIGPVLAAVATPRFSNTIQRAARSEAYRAFGVVPDSSLDAQEAGVILNDLINVGSQREVDPTQLPPTRTYDSGWFEGGVGADNPSGMEQHFWPDSLIGLVAASPSPELVAYLATVAGHEAHAAFARLASAPEIDIAAARWRPGFMEGMTLSELPIPRFSGLRLGSYAHIGAAGYEMAMGRNENAERMIRDVISVGLLLGDNGNTLIENLIGYVIARNGGRALLAFYRATGRDADAEALARLEAAVEAASDRLRPQSWQGAEAFLRSVPAVVTDRTAVRGLRWEYLGLISTLSPCLNMNRMVFGADASYSSFVDAARASLVRYPSEEALFEVVTRGYFGGAGSPSGFLGRLFTVSIRSGRGSCGEIVGQLELLRQIM